MLITVVNTAHLDICALSVFAVLTQGITQMEIKMHTFLKAFAMLSLVVHTNTDIASNGNQREKFKFCRNSGLCTLGQLIHNRVFWMFCGKLQKCSTSIIPLMERRFYVDDPRNIVCGHTIFNQSVGFAASCCSLWLLGHCRILHPFRKPTDTPSKVSDSSNIKK